MIKPAEAWVLSDPERLYPQTKAYHVTASPALINLVDGGSLVPSCVVDSDRVLETHRGPAGTVAGYLLETVFGITQHGSPLLVWAGTKVDNQQVWIERRIAQSPGSASQKLRETFFCARNSMERRVFSSDQDKQDYEGQLARDPYLGITYVWNERFIQFMKSLKEGEGVSDTKMASDILDSFWMATGMRDGWYGKVASIVKGETRIPDNLYEEIIREHERSERPFDFALLYRLHTQQVSHQNEAQAVVLEVNPQHVFKRYKKPVLVMPGDPPRNPHSIIGLPNVTLSDVVRVFVDSPNNLPSSVSATLGQHGIDLRQIDLLSEDDRMIPDKGFSFEQSEVDPNDPACLLRYVYDRHAVQGMYRSVYRSGALHPLWDIDLGDPTQYQALVNRLGPRWPRNRTLRGILGRNGQIEL